MNLEKNDQPLVSIIIPTYNRAGLIGETLNSIIQQTYPHWEAWICDDGSEDDTESVLQPYLADQRIHLLKNDHSGLPAVSRNRGIAHASGEYVAFVDSDDAWIPEKLAVQVKVLQENPDVGLVCTNASTLHDEDKKNIGTLLRENQGKSGDVVCELIHDNFIITSSVLTRRSLLEETGLFCEEKEFLVGEDYDLWLRIATLTKIRYIKEPLTVYRMATSNSVFAKDSRDRLLRRLLAIYLRYEAFLVDRQLLTKEYQECIRDVYSMYWDEVRSLLLNQRRYRELWRWFIGPQSPYRLRGLRNFHSELIRQIRARIHRGWGIRRRIRKLIRLLDLPTEYFRANKTYDKPFGAIHLEPDKCNILCMLPRIGMGGAERVLLNIAQNIDRSKFCFHVAADQLETHGWEQVFDETFKNVFRLGAINPWMIKKTLCQLITQLDIQLLLISDSLEGFRFLPILHANFPNVKVMDIVHSYESPGVTDRFIRAASYVDRRVCISHDLEEYAAQQYCKQGHDGDLRQRLRVIHNGINMENYRKELYDTNHIRRQFGFAENERIVAYIGRFSEEKQPMLFLQIAKQLIEQQPDLPVRFVMAGDGKLYPHVAAALEASDMAANISLLGIVHKIEELLAVTDILLITSRIEGIPFAAIEALAMNVPVISSDVGAVHEVINNGINGFLVKPGPAYISQVVDLLSRLLTPSNLLNTLSSQTRISIEKEYSMKTMLSDYQKLFDELC